MPDTGNRPGNRFLQIIPYTALTVQDKTRQTIGSCNGSTAVAGADGCGGLLLTEVSFQKP